MWYRVNSVKATHFRIRQTQLLKEYMQKDFQLDIRIKTKRNDFNKVYFSELLERMCSIMASEGVHG
ncbi:MAG: virulence RhuM family protein [Christensenellaceae bacterium]|nr:virulence RhuM family protein [Christensenellaceae bacterium]